MLPVAMEKVSMVVEMIARLPHAVARALLPVLALVVTSAAEGMQRWRLIRLLQMNFGEVILIYTKLLCASGTYRKALPTSRLTRSSDQKLGGAFGRTGVLGKHSRKVKVLT